MLSKQTTNLDAVMLMLQLLLILLLVMGDGRVISCPRRIVRKCMVQNKSYSWKNNVCLETANMCHGLTFSLHVERSELAFRERTDYREF